MVEWKDIWYIVTLLLMVTILPLYVLKLLLLEPLSILIEVMYSNSKWRDNSYHWYTEIQLCQSKFRYYVFVAAILDDVLLALDIMNKIVFNL